MNGPRPRDASRSTEQTGQLRHALDRRSFCKLVGTAGVVAAVDIDRAHAQTPPGQDPVGILVDTTRCLGCRACEFACATANDLPKPASGFDVFERTRDTSETQYSVVNRYDTARGKVYVKRQCMHCRQPACASACLTKAMLKTREGPVVWREDKCMGCRFCMISCPFDGPKFEYDSPVPKIQKCQLCWKRVEEGKAPACVEACPANALTFGKRSELLVDARRRIAEHADRYVQHIYGEHEVGGTSWLYLAGVPFDQLGFRTDLGTVPYPSLTTGFLYSVPVVLTLAPAFLLAVHNATKRTEAHLNPGVAHDRGDTVPARGT